MEQWCKGTVIAFDYKSDYHNHKKLDTPKTFTAIGVLSIAEEGFLSVCIDSPMESDDSYIFVGEYLDNMLDNCTLEGEVRRATVFEIQYLIASLVSQHISFYYTKEGTIVVPEYEGDSNSEMVSVKTEPLPISPLEIKKYRFCQYITALHKCFQETQSLKGMSKIREQYKISGINKDLFYLTKLDRATDVNYSSEQWKQFCDSLYMYVLGKSKGYPEYGCNI